MPDNAESLARSEGFYGWLCGEFGVWVGVFDDFNSGFDTVVGEFGFEMGGGRDNKVGEVGVVNH